MLKFLFDIQQVAQLVVSGITTVETVMTVVQSGRAAIREATSETAIPVDELPARLEAARQDVLALAAQIGDETAARIEARGDGTGHP